MKTKAKAAKRMLSVLLSLLLVFTMVPTFTFTASAAHAPVAYSTRTVLANCTPITIEDGETSGYTKIRYGSNYLSFAGSGLKTGVNEYEADLSNTSVYGGYQYDSSGDTSVTVNGGKIGEVFGGSYASALTGNTNVVINGGTIGTVCGGNSSSTLTGSVSIEINGGNINHVRAGENGVITGDVSIRMTDGTVSTQLSSAISDYYGYIDGKAYVTITGGTVNRFRNYFSLDNTATCVDTKLVVCGTAWLKDCIFFGSNSKCSFYLNQDKTCNFSGIGGLQGYDLANFCKDYAVCGTNWLVRGDIVNALRGYELVVDEGETLTIPSDMSVNARIRNFGTVTVNGAYSGEIDNYGTMNISGSVEGAYINNYKTVECFGSHNGATISNSGTFYCYNAYEQKVEGDYYCKSYISYSFDNMKATNIQGNVIWNEEYTATFVADEGYLLPETVHVLHDGAVSLNEGEHFSYNNKTGEFKLFKGTVTNAFIYIWAEAVAIKPFVGYTEKGVDYYTAEIDTTSFTYDGTEKKPNVNKVIYHEAYWATALENPYFIAYYDTVLVEGVDYVVTYSDNLAAGTGKVYVTGIGKYKDSLVNEFTINAAYISGSTVTVDDLTWNGTSQTAPVTVTYNGVTLEEGVDYTITGNVNTSAGEYTLKLTGIGNFKGTKSVKWNINKINLSDAEVTVSDKYFTGSTLTQEPVVKLGDMTLRKDVHYTLSGNTATDAGTYKMTITGIGNFEGSIDAQWTVNTRDMSFVTAKTDGKVTYNGTEQIQGIVVTYGDNTLTAGVDYVISNNTATDAGTYTMAITGIGNYSGTKSFIWTMYTLNVSDADANVTVEPMIYNGAEQIPVGVVTVETENDTLTVTGEWNPVKNVSDRATFVANGNFHGYVYVDSVISPKDITDLDVNISDSEQYTGYTPYPAVGGFTYGEDYIVAWDQGDEIGVGEYTGTLTGIGSCTGTKEISLTVVPRTINITGVKSTGKTYDGTTSIRLSSLDYNGVVVYDDKGTFETWDDITDQVYINGNDIIANLSDCVPGAYDRVKLENITLSGEDAANYTVASELESILLYYEYNSGYPVSISKCGVSVTAENQDVSADEEIDQTKYIVEHLPEGFTLTDIVLTIDGDNDEIFPSGGKVTNADGEDVTAYFDFTYYSSNLTIKCTDHDTSDNGFCPNCTVYESAVLKDNGTPEEEWDDYYEIANGGQLYWYADKVNNYGVSYGAKLVADIVINEDLTAENLRQWTPIDYLYADFDGQGHTISGLYVDSEDDYVGFYGISGYYSLRNLIITNSYFKGGSAVGAIAGYNQGEIINCGVTDTVTVEGDGYDIGAFVGDNANSIKNSYAMADNFVATSSEYYGATMENCYYIGAEDTDGYNGTDVVSAEDFASGKAAYLLQAGVPEEDVYDENWDYVGAIIPEIWGQKIGTDTYPVIGGDKVYEVINCVGETAYSNSDADGAHNLENGVCTVCGAIDGIAQVAGYTISLTDKIAVNYHMLLSAEVLADENAKMVFTVPDTGSTYTLEIPVSEADVIGNYYVFTCEVASKEMTSAISAKIVTTDAESDAFEYTVKQYAEVILEKAAESSTENAYSKAASLVKAMLNYGAQAQVYFGYNTDNLANDTEFMTEEEKNVEPYDFEGASYTLEGEEAGVTYYGSALSLKSELAVKHFFIIDESVDVDTLDIQCDYPVTFAKNGSYYELKISDISAHHMDYDISVTIGGLTLEYSIYSYGALAQVSGKTGLVDLVSVMVEYAHEAVAYAQK